jgi:flavin-dependent dehydrogenase
VELYLFPGGYAGLSPVEGGRVNLCLLATRTAFTRAGASTEAMLTAAAHMNPALRQRLRGGRRVPGTSLAVAPVDTERAAVPWDIGARVGDAVTMIPPLCGDGMAMALRSAELCAPLAHEFLCGDLSLAEWEHRYHATWQREFASTLRAGRRLQAFLALPGITDALLGVGNWLPWLTEPIVQATRGRLRSLDELAGQ